MNTHRIIPPSAKRLALTRLTPNGIAIHDAAEPLPGLPLGPFARRGDGGILAVAERAVLLSRDEGRTWTKRPVFADDQDLHACAEGALIRTRRGTLIHAFINLREKHWPWSDAAKDAPGARLPTYVMRSVDDGNTWQDIQKLHDEWTGAIRSMIETRDGRIVFTTMQIRHAPCRHTVLTYASTDEGETWAPSNIIDLGGRGDHGGMTEATIAELRDGTVLKYVRTNWGQFWKAVSADGGRHWHPLGPSGVDASSAPGQLHRLASGRLLLVWNRYLPEGETTVELTGGDDVWSETPVSNFRGELSLAFSDDEAGSWSPATVIARKLDTWLAYPYVFEVEPGVLWVTTMQGDLRVRLREADFG